MFIDIAFNATSSEFKNKLENVLQNSKDSGVMPIFVGLDTESSAECIELAKKYNTYCYFGIHPLHLGMKCDINPVSYDIKKLLFEFNQKIEEIKTTKTSWERVIAFGELGLDYFKNDNFDDQKELFNEQLNICKKHDFEKPYFLHCRSSFNDLKTSIKSLKGVVHSFDGSLEEAKEIIEMGLYIGINGCSLRTEENIKTVREIPLERILLETDSPYCLIRKSYAASRYTNIIKARNNEPMFVKQIAQVLAEIKEIEVEEVEKVTFENTLTLFPELLNSLKFWDSQFNSSF